MPRRRWHGIDILGAIALSLTVSTGVFFAGSYIDALRDPASDESAPAALAAAIVGAAVSLLVARLTRVPTAATVFTIGTLFGANVAVHLASDGGQTELLGLPPSFVESAVLSGVPFAMAWLYVNRKYRRSLGDLGFVPPASPTAYAYAFGAWLVAFVGVVLWGLLVTDIDTITPPDNTTPILEIAGGSLLAAWLLAGLWGPFVEEVFFRGFLLGGLSSRIGQWPALLVSSAIFGLFHIHPGLYVPTFLLGLAFGWVYLKTRSIWAPVFAHTLHNTLVIVNVWRDSG